MGFDIISDQAFGFDANCVESSAIGLQFAHNCQLIASMVMKHQLHIPGIARLYKMWHRHTFAQVDSTIYGCIANRRLERKSAGDSPRARDLLDLMLDASESGGGWT